MAILAISKLGNPILRQQAQSVSPSEIKKAAFQQLIDDMFEPQIFLTKKQGC